MFKRKFSTKRRVGLYKKRKKYSYPYWYYKRKPKEEVNVMPRGQMSHDRVEFSIPMRRLDNEKIRQVLRDVFSLKESEIPKYSYDNKFKIICRPSQFARFIILRQRMGIENYVTELDAKLIPSDPITPQVEVWNRPTNI